MYIFEKAKFNAEQTVMKRIYIYNTSMLVLVDFLFRNLTRICVVSQLEDTVRDLGSGGSLELLHSGQLNVSVAVETGAESHESVFLLSC